MEPREPVAIIGIGCRFPGGADSPDAYWKLLLDGVDAVSEVPADRWDVGGVYHPDRERPGKLYTKSGAFLDQVDQFDADFFGISPREASRMDPQHRLLLEVAWEALEDAGLDPAGLANSRTGVFIGICDSEYADIQYADTNSINAYTNAGVSESVAANRISYTFDLRGPSIALDTACSSSLVALHLACGSLWGGESEAALVGGVNLILGPARGIGFGKASMLSPTGRCRAFDSTADGFVRGEGAGVVVEKVRVDEYTGKRYTFFADPDGLPLELYER